MNYKCIKEMTLPKCDGNGCTIENEYGYVPEGSEWYEDDSSIIGGEIHLECAGGSDDFGWIEITMEDLKEYFAEVENG